MTPYKRRMNPYIQRMVGDMQLRNLADSTIDAYTYHADKFCQFFGKPAEELGPEEIRQYQLYLVNERKVSWSTYNQATCGLRFLYEVTLAKPWTVRHIPFGKRPKKLPMVLSNEEASRLPIYVYIVMPNHWHFMVRQSASSLILPVAVAVADLLSGASFVRAADSSHLAPSRCSPTESSANEINWIVAKLQRRCLFDKTVIRNSAPCRASSRRSVTATLVRLCSVDRARYA